MLRRCGCAKFVPIEAVVVYEGGDVLESLVGDGVCNGGVWGVGVEVFPVVSVVLNKVGDCAEGFIWYNGMLRGHDGAVCVRKRGTNGLFYGR